MIRSANIAGAGIGGLTAAIALARQGVTVCVYEQATELTEVGAGLQLSPNAMRVMAALGIEEALQAVAFAPERARVIDGVTGRDRVNLPLRAVCHPLYGAPYLHVHRADVQAILYQEAQRLGVTFKLGQAVTGYTKTGLMVAGEEQSADLSIGADGIRSAIGAQMHLNLPVRFTGQVAWRGSVRTADLPKGLIGPDASVWVGQGKHLVTYYLRGGDLVNFVAVEERDNWHNPSWTEQGDPAQLQTAFAGWHPKVQTLLAGVKQPFLWALFDRPVLPFWSEGPIGLLGDACHPTLPFMAQGAAMAIEDAFVLARCVATEKDATTALTRYTALRKPRTSRLQARARSNGALFHQTGFANGLLPRLKLAVAGQLSERLALRPFDEVYGYNATTVLS
ncbi:FAD-dependent monooxygenase [Roseobacter sp. N2S]|uniref:FAD-dependent monooxygenase n=1 Tax=Roseobacter sp. N2S TaxID=2663844 RepID=UPI002859834F|nr:FAD-dependent monooxygenase [Roseobacter sp. N2S]MDR6265093.1 salicylate hydroxylase [Roseobacter sp. N2S]